MEGNNRKRNFTIIGICSLILVAMVVAVVVTMNWNDKGANAEDISTTKKAVESICQPTQYQHTCVETLESTADGSSDPKELIEKSFQVTIKKINEAIDNTTFMKKLEKDPRAKMALENCEKLAMQAVNDLNRTLIKFESFEFNDLSHWIADLKIWLSGAITYQETCLDGFEKTTGETGEKMKKALNVSMELTSNALSMITEISAVFTSLNAGSNRRRLLSETSGHGIELLPDWIDAGRRRLLAVNISNKIKPDMVVAKDGSGKYKFINDALKHIPQHGNQTFVLYIKEGVYNEKVEFTSTMTNLLVIGDGPTKTRITGNQNFKDGIPTFQTATVAVMGDYFIAKDIGFENSAGPDKHQAIALKVAADKSIFYNCHVDGYQDTLCVHTYRQFYRGCTIRGTIDFVFGDGAAVFQNCTIAVRKPLKEQHCIVTAQGRTDARQPTGLVFQNCSIVADDSYNEVKGEIKTYLGRPWKQYSRTVIMESSIGDLIQPEGWLEWNKTFAFDTLFYTEFNNIGSGSSKTDRVNWSGVKELPMDRVQRFTASKFLDGDVWIPSTGVPYTSGFFLSPPQSDASIKYSPVDDEEYKDIGSADAVAAPVSAPAESPSESTADAPSTEAPKSETSEESPAQSPPPESPAADTDEYSAAVQVPSPAESPSGEIWLHGSWDYPFRRSKIQVSNETSPSRYDLHQFLVCLFAREKESVELIGRSPWPPRRPHRRRSLHRLLLTGTVSVIGATAKIKTRTLSRSARRAALAPNVVVAVIHHPTAILLPHHPKITVLQAVNVKQSTVQKDTYIKIEPQRRRIKREGKVTGKNVRSIKLKRSSRWKVVALCSSQSFWGVTRMMESVGVLSLEKRFS